jgi:hypothetical protein
VREIRTHGSIGRGPETGSRQRLTGTELETTDTAKSAPTECRAGPPDPNHLLFGQPSYSYEVWLLLPTISAVSAILWRNRLTSGMRSAAITRSSGISDAAMMPRLLPFPRCLSIPAHVVQQLPDSLVPTT